jgi:hypothetical protein
MLRIRLSMTIGVSFFRALCNLCGCEKNGKRPASYNFAGVKTQFLELLNPDRYDAGSVKKHVYEYGLKQ